jgi:hypothetical protein
VLLFEREAWLQTDVNVNGIKNLLTTLVKQESELVVNEMLDEPVSGNTTEHRGV